MTTRLVGILADKKAKNKSRIVLVSGFVPPPGRPRFGSQRQRVLGICEKRRFFHKKQKKRIFKIPFEKNYFPLLRDPLFSVKIMEGILCFLKFAFFEKSCRSCFGQESYCSPTVRPSIRPPCRRPTELRRAKRAPPPSDPPYTLTPDRPPLAACYW